MPVPLRGRLEQTGPHLWVLEHAPAETEGGVMPRGDMMSEKEKADELARWKAARLRPGEKDNDPNVIARWQEARRKQK